MSDHDASMHIVLRTSHMRECTPWSMILKSVKRFSETIMLKQKDKARRRLEETPSRFSVRHPPASDFPRRSIDQPAVW
jgi:hypothetical protein